MNVKRYGVNLSGEVHKFPSGVFVRHADHAAFVERVREIAERMEHTSTCPAHKCECGASKGYHGPLKPRGLILDHDFTPKKCTCPRGKLLALCEVK